MVFINREERKAEFLKRGRTPSQSIKKLVITTIAVFTILIFTMSSSAFARECAGLAPNAKIDCAAENMITGFSTLAGNLDELESASRGKFSTSSSDINKKVERMGKMRERSFEAGAFKNLAKKQDIYKKGNKKASDSSCFILEEGWEKGGDNTKDQNIICGDSPGEKCAEYCPEDCEDPDDSYKCPCNKKYDGICRGKEVCEECCEGDDKCETAWIDYMNDPESGTDPIDEEAADDMAVSFQEAADALSNLNASAVEFTFAMDSYNSLVSSDNVHDQRCSKGALLQASVVAKSTSYMMDTLAAYAITSDLHDICDSGANQDVWGMNGSAACLVTATAKGIAYTLYEEAELLYDIVTSDQIVNLTECSTALSEGLEGISDGIQEVDKKIVELQRIMIERFDEVNKLLNTPQGQRPDFPVK